MWREWFAHYQHLYHGDEMKVTCNRCGGENISQAASLMVDLLDWKNRSVVLDLHDLQWEDHFYCKDCEDEVTVTEGEER